MNRVGRTLALFALLSSIFFSTNANAFFGEMFDKMFGNGYTNGENVKELLFKDKLPEATLADKVNNVLTDMNPIQKGGDMAKKIGTGNPASGLIADQLFSILAIIGIGLAIVKSIANGGKGLAGNVGAALGYYALIIVLMLNYQSIFVVGITGAFKTIGADLYPVGDINTYVADTTTTLFMTAVGIFAKIGDNIFTLNPLAMLDGVLVMLPLAWAAWVVITAAFRLVIIFFLGDFLAGVGLALGPLFLAMGVLPWFKNYMGSWLNYLLSALLFKVVAIVVIGIAGQSLMGFINQSIGAPYKGASIFTDAFIIMLVAMVFKEVISAVPSIASTLFNGGIGMISGGGSAGSAAAMGGMAGGLASGVMRDEAKKSEAAQREVKAKEQEASKGES